MQEPSLEQFDLTKELIESAQLSHNKEEKVSNFFCVFLYTLLDFIWAYVGVRAYVCGLWANSVGGFRIFYRNTIHGICCRVGCAFSNGTLVPFSRFYSPILDRYSKFRKAQKEYETWKEHERIRIWREEEAAKRFKAEYWLELGGHAFEHELARLLRKLGWETKVTPGSDDKGIDIFLIQDGLRKGVQCKAHRNPVGPSIVRELLGACLAAKCDRLYLLL